MGQREQRRAAKAARRAERAERRAERRAMKRERRRARRQRGAAGGGSGSGSSDSDSSSESDAEKHDIRVEVQGEAGPGNPEAEVRIEVDSKGGEGGGDGEAGEVKIEIRADGEGAGPAVRRLSKVLSGLVTPELVETIQHAVKDVTQHVAGAAKKAGATKQTAEQVEAAFKAELGGVREKLVPHLVDIARQAGPKVAELNVAVRGPLAELRKEIEPKAQELKEALVPESPTPLPRCCCCCRTCAVLPLTCAHLRTYLPSHAAPLTVSLSRSRLFR